MKVKRKDKLRALERVIDRYKEAVAEVCPPRDQDVIMDLMSEWAYADGDTEPGEPIM